MSWDEERAGRALRTGLLGIEPPASRVEVERIVVDGRRGERRARLVRVLGGAALAVAVGVPLAVLVVGGRGTTQVGPAGETAAAPTRPADCTVTDLNGSGPGGAMEAADPTGTVVFGVNGNRLIRWRDGVSEAVASSDSGGVLMPTAVNPAGTAVGFHAAVPVPTPDTETGWVFRNGALTQLVRPAGARTAFPHAINEAGDIVGTVTTESPTARSVLVVWPAAAPRSPRLIQPEVAAVPVGIAADGSVVGIVLGLGGRDSTVAVWAADGTRRDLPVPPGWGSATATAARGDVVYGTVSRFDPPARSPAADFVPQPAGTPRAESGSGETVKKRSPARWNLRDGTSTVYPVDGGLAAAAGSGWLLVDTGGPFDGRAVAVGPDGTPYALPAPAGTVGSVRGEWISDDGRTVIAQVVVGPGVAKPFRWTCAVG